MIEKGFLNRVFKMSAGVAVFGAWFLLALSRYAEAASFAVGAAVGLALLWSARFTVERTLTAENGRGKAWAAAVMAGKYGVAGMVVWAMVRWRHASLPWFAAGVAVTQAVLFLKALGHVIAPDREPLSRERLGRVLRAAAKPGARNGEAGCREP